MDEQQLYWPALSLHLSRVLDVIGVNERTVQKRRLTCLKGEKILNVSFKCMESFHKRTYFILGSRSEGSTTPKLMSDVDMLCCIEDINVIHDWTEWQQGKVNLLMLHTDTAPGYCRLQVLRSDEPLSSEHLPDEYSAYDSCNKVIVKHTFLRMVDSRVIRNGPADTFIGDEVDFDTVGALRCSSWPPYALKWTSRHRHGHWPTRQLLEQAIKDDIFLVAVGYKFSHTQDLEYRISFSITERRLMFNMNITQLKCYVVLKLLMKSFVCPHARDSISSYHCKTAMFYCMEETDSEYWREDNLVECIVKCLRLLLTWVNNEFCPHFIIPEANLFAGKITPQNKRQVQSVLKDLIESNGRCLLYIPTDELGQTLHGRLSIPPSLSQILHSPQTIRVIDEMDMCSNEWVGVLRRKCLLMRASTDAQTVIMHVSQFIRELCACSSQTDTYGKQAIQICVQFLSAWLGSLLASVSLSCKRKISLEALRLLRLGTEADPSLLLKTASIFYCNGDLHKTESILNEVADRLGAADITTICTCSRSDYTFNYDLPLQLDTDEDEDAQAAMFAHCVRFSPEERNCAPPALRHEFCRSVGDDLLHRDPKKDKWMILAAVDCLPFLYYLQYITYGELGKYVLQQEALQNLEKCPIEGNNYGHIETVWNLLGQCMEQEEKLEDAMRCYKTSLKIRRRNNAANWHVQNLRYQSIRNCGEITETE